MSTILGQRDGRSSRRPSVSHPLSHRLRRSCSATGDCGLRSRTQAGLRQTRRERARRDPGRSQTPASTTDSPSLARSIRGRLVQRRRSDDIIFWRVSRALSFVSSRKRSHRACNSSRATVWGRGSPSQVRKSTTSRPRARRIMATLLRDLPRWSARMRSGIVPSTISWSRVHLDSLRLASRRASCSGAGGRRSLDKAPLR